MRHFLTIIDHDPDTLRHLLAEAARLKAAVARGDFADTLRHKIVGLVFEKPSLRTRVSFEAGVAQLGGTSLFLAGSEVGLGVREAIAGLRPDHVASTSTASCCACSSTRPSSRWPKCATVPVINGLSDTSHPCQAMADLLTIQERRRRGGQDDRVHRRRQQRGPVAGRRCAASSASQFVLARPDGYGFPAEFAKNYTTRVGPKLPQEIDTTRRRR